ncbi:hypothetical protein [Acidithrix ferrooxidans]|nr:hypothetical protein [Acidithrix ferrooxidans]
MKLPIRGDQAGSRVEIPPSMKRKKLEAAMRDSQIAVRNGSMSLQPLDQMTPSLARQTRRQIERVVGAGMVKEAHEQVRAILANTALENVGALSALEAHLISIAPLGEARYKHIVDAYAMGAAREITKW